MARSDWHIVEEGVSGSLDFFDDNPDSDRYPHPFGFVKDEEGNRLYVPGYYGRFGLGAFSGENTLGQVFSRIGRHHVPGKLLAVTVSVEARIGKPDTERVSNLRFIVP